MRFLGLATILVLVCTAAAVAFLLLENNAPQLHPTTNNEKILFSFAVYGDPGSINPTFTKIIDRINAENVAFMISTGDNTDGKSKNDLVAMRDYLNVHAKHPWYATLGDNDWVVNPKSGKRDRTAYTEVFGATQQTWVYQNSRFIVLDCSDDTEGFLDTDLDWFETTLRTAHEQHIFVIMHQPVQVPLGALVLGEPSPARAAREQRFIDLVNTYHVRHVFTGNLHNYLTYTIGNVPLTITGGASEHDQQIGLGLYPHYLVVDVTATDAHVRVVPL